MHRVNLFNTYNGRYYLFGLTCIAIFLTGVVFSVYAGKDDCTNIDGDGAVPIMEVNDEVANTPNDYDEVVEEDTRDGVVYLALIGGSQPTPNGCGLIPKNDASQWTGWGGPLNFDNVTIGEGATTRNPIVIGGTYFERGIGAHAIATLVYDLSGDNYLRFEAYVGMSDEKDPTGCNHGGSSHFTFSVDGEDLVVTETLEGTVDGVNVEPLKVEFEIPADAQELTIVMGDGGDGNSCDHSTIGDAKLLTTETLAVEPANKLPTIWGHLKSRY